MKRFGILMVFGMLALGAAGALAYAEPAGTAAKPSEEELKLGRELFNQKQPLEVKFACILCHQKEKAIKHDKAVQLGDKLPEVINLHITEKAKGSKRLDKESKEMKALIAYILNEHSV